MSCLYTVTKREGNKKHQMLVQMFFGWFSPQKLKKSENNIWQKTWTTSRFRLHSLPKASWGFPTNILLRGHGCVGSVHPRPPSPRGAAGPRNRGLAQLPSAAVFGLGSRGPRPSHGQNPAERRGEKIRRKFWAPQKSKFRKLWPLKNPPWTWGTMWFWGSFDDIELAEKAMWTRLAVKMLDRNFKNAPSLRKQICVRLGHNRIWNQSPTVGILWNRVEA